MTTATIDVLIPVFNAERTLEDSLSSILTQSFSNIRIIAVDDGSTDSSAAILARVAESDNRVIVITTENRGIVAALNEALAHSKAEFIARHDSDDLAAPSRFQEQLAYLMEHNDCVAVGCSATIIDENGIPRGTTQSFNGAVVGDPYRVPPIEPYIMHPFLMVRGETLRELRYRYVIHAEDTDLYWRLLSKGRLHNLPRVLGCYRQHTNSITSGSVQNGRIGAVYATLAALSYLRVQDGVPDLVFPSEAVTSLKSLLSLPQIIGFAGKDLTSPEREFARVSSSAKLIQNATYRSYLLERSDCRFLAAEMEKIKEGVSGPEWREISIDVTQAVLRLSRAGMVLEAFTLLKSVGSISPMLRLIARRLRLVVRGLRREVP